MRLPFILPLALAITLSSFDSAAAYRRVCYFGSWAKYRWGNGYFDVESIDPFLCTHLYFGFVGINVDGSVRIMDPWNEIDNRALERFNDLKKKNPQLKTLLASGGWNEGSEKYSIVANNPALRTAFVKSALNLTLFYKYDGFDLDWEYPAQRGGGLYDKANFILLIKEFRQEFDKYGLLVTAAVASAEASASQSYDVPNVSKYLDFINVMTYDLHGTWDGVVGHNSPLYPSSSDVTPAQQQLNADACIRWWIRNGADPAKLLLGVGLYGRTFTLADRNNAKLGAPTWIGGQAGPYTQESGFLGYNEIIERFQQGGWTRVWDDEQKVPHAYKGDQWIGYDDEESIKYKAQYIIDRGLGGAIVWSVETDDFRALSGKKNPLLTALKTNLESGTPNPGIPVEPPVIVDPVEPDPNNPSEPQEPNPSEPQEPNPSEPQDPNPSEPQEPNPSEPQEPNPSEPQEPNPSEPQQPDPSNPSEPKPLCSTEGYVRDPVECGVFYYCQKTGNSFTPLQQSCPGGLYYDVARQICDWPAAVSC